MIRRYNRGGQPVEHLTVTGIADVAKEIVLRNMERKGKVCDFDLLEDDAGAILVEELLESLSEEKCFVPKESISRRIAAEVLGIMNMIRSGSQKEECEEESVDSSRFHMLLKLIGLYEKELEQKQVYDKNLLLKRALEIIDEAPDLFSYLSSSDYVEVSYQIPEESAKRSYRFFRGYGLVNEI